jgi:TPR repeat protein
MTQHIVPVVLALACLSMSAALSQEELVPDVSGIRASAERGDADAQLLLGAFYYNGKYGLPRNYDVAFHWYRRAAEQGLPIAECTVGSCYLTGLEGVVAKDVGEALKWYRKAAEHDNPQAIYYLGTTYEREPDVRDLVQSHAWFSLSFRRDQDNGINRESLDNILKDLARVEEKMTPEQKTAAAKLLEDLRAKMAERKPVLHGVRAEAAP